MNAGDWRTLIALVDEKVAAIDRAQRMTVVGRVQDSLLKERAYLLELRAKLVRRIQTRLRLVGGNREG